MKSNKHKFSIRQTVAIQPLENQPGITGRISHISTNHRGTEYVVKGEDGVIYYLVEAELTDLLESQLIETARIRSNTEEESKPIITVAQSRTKAKCSGCGKVQEVQSVYLPFGTAVFGLCSVCKEQLREQLTK